MPNFNHISSEPNPPLLQVEDLAVRYGPPGADFSAVDGVSFNLGSGEVVGLLGESGCGKTTIALSILGLLPAGGRVIRGSIRFRARELLGLGEDQLQTMRGSDISCIFQEPEIALNPIMRVGDQIAAVIRAHRNWNWRRCREEARSVLTQVWGSDSAHVYAAYPQELSGGQQQRIVIAQALGCRPALLIADEPTAALDTIIQAGILSLLKDLQERYSIALLLISHNPGVLAKIANRLLVMYAGSIVEEGRLADVYRDPLHPYTRGLLQCIPQRPANTSGRHKFLLSIAGGALDPTQVHRGCPFEPRCPDKMEICAAGRPNRVQLETSRGVRCFKYGQ